MKCFGLLFASVLVLGLAFCRRFRGRRAARERPRSKDLGHRRQQGRQVLEKHPGRQRRLEHRQEPGDHRHRPDRPAQDRPGRRQGSRSAEKALKYIESLVNPEKKHIAGKDPKVQLQNYVTSINVMALVDGQAGRQVQGGHRRRGRVPQEAAVGRGRRQGPEETTSTAAPATTASRGPTCPTRSSSSTPSRPPASPKDDPALKKAAGLRQPLPEPQGRAQRPALGRARSTTAASSTPRPTGGVTKVVDKPLRRRQPARLRQHDLRRHQEHDLLRRHQGRPARQEGLRVDPEELHRRHEPRHARGRARSGACTTTTTRWPSASTPSASTTSWTPRASSTTGARTSPRPWPSGSSRTAASQQRRQLDGSRPEPRDRLRPDGAELLQAEEVQMSRRNASVCPRTAETLGSEATPLIIADQHCARSPLAVPSTCSPCPRGPVLPLYGPSRLAQGHHDPHHRPSVLTMRRDKPTRSSSGSTTASKSTRLTVILEDMLAVQRRGRSPQVRNKPLDLLRGSSRASTPRSWPATSSAELDGKELHVHLRRARPALTMRRVRRWAICAATSSSRPRLYARPKQDNSFKFSEGNYQSCEGQINLSLADEPGLQILSKSEPDAALKSRPAIDSRPATRTSCAELGAIRRLRRPPSLSPRRRSRPPPDQQPSGATTSASASHCFGIPTYGLWMLLLHRGRLRGGCTP